MWQTKVFKTREAQLKWIDKHDHRVQWQEIFVNNAYGVQYRPLNRVY